MRIEQIKTHRYPGVKPFSENERHVFYGRTFDTKKLYQLINLEKGFTPGYLCVLICSILIAIDEV